MSRKTRLHNNSTLGMLHIKRIRRQSSHFFVSSVPKKEVADVVLPETEKKLIKKEEPVFVEHTLPLEDTKKRQFFKFLGIAGLGVVGSLFLPKRADALVFGSTPTSNVVGVKNTSNEEVNPATDESVQSLLSGQGVEKITTSLSSSGNVIVPASGKKIRVYSARFSLTADLTSVSFRFTSGGTDYEKYLSPKTGGLYGANNHPNYVEGGIDEPLYAVISGTGTIQINIDYIEV